MVSEWSQCMLRGELIARFTTTMTLGSRSPEAMLTTSNMRAKPAAEVAVIARAPAACAPTTADIAECSLSTFTSVVPTLPFATNSENLCMSSVCGVIGKTAATSGFTCLKASAAASLPVRATRRAVFLSSIATPAIVTSLPTRASSR